MGRKKKTVVPTEQRLEIAKGVYLEVVPSANKLDPHVLRIFNSTNKRVLNLNKSNTRSVVDKDFEDYKEVFSHS